MTPKPHVYLRNTIWARTGQATQTASGGRPGLAPGLWSVQLPRGQSGLCLGLGIPVLPLTNWRSLSSLGVSSPVKWGYARTPAQGGGDGGGHRPGPARTRRSNRARRRYPSQPICRRIYSTGDSGARLSPLSSPTVSGDALGLGSRWQTGDGQVAQGQPILDASPPTHLPQVGICATSRMRVGSVPGPAAHHGGRMSSLRGGWPSRHPTGKVGAPFMLVNTTGHHQLQLQGVITL